MTAAAQIEATFREEHGRVLAALHGVMGVVTTGVIAGLILRWISPRRLDL